MKKTDCLKHKSIVSAVAAFVFLSVIPAFAFFDDSIDDIITDNESASVSGVTGTAGNGSVMLFWNIKTDGEGTEATKYRIEYGKKSVADGEAEEYEANAEVTDDVPSIKLENLTNDTAYYFTVIAVFADESETPPSEEITVTPASSLNQDMTETPVVVSAEGVSKHEMVIHFSKIIVLPEEKPELAFLVTDEQDEEEILEVVSARFNTDEEGKEIKTEALIATTEIQESTATYQVTVSAQITDVDGRPIQSGSTDSAVFTGYDGELDYVPASKPVEETTKTPTGSETETPADTTTGETGTNSGSELAEIVQDDQEATDSTDNDLEYILESLVNETGFDAPLDAETGDDDTPPEDVTNLIATFKARLTDFLVTLTWNRSADTAGDLDDQTLYRSTDHGDNWGNGVSLGKDTTRTHIPEKPETEITYKITTKDVAGNESVGVIRSVSLPALPQTGPGLLIPFGLTLTVAGVRRLKKLKK